MNRRLVLVSLALALCVALVGDAVAGPISVGNLVVVRAGTGTGSISGNATAAFLEEFTPNGTSLGTHVQTIALPTAAAGSQAALTLSGSATSEGYISQSANGKYLTLAGYNAAPGATSPQSSTASTVNRVVGRVDIATGTIDTSTKISDAYHGSNIRSAATSDGIDIWTAGNRAGTDDDGGVRYLTFGSTSGSVRVNSGGTNRRVVEIHYGRLYDSASSSPHLSLSTMVSPLPTVNETESVLPGLPNSGTHSVYDMWFADPSTLYLADDSSAANGGGIQKWTLNAGVWSLQYILLNNATNTVFPTNGTATTAIRGLTGISSSAGNVLYATTAVASANRLIRIVDTGPLSVATTVATAAANTVYRGVEYIQIPEPASLTVLGVGCLLATCLMRRR